jgi:phosphoribosylglycinamide formyltransferase-1
LELDIDAIDQHTKTTSHKIKIAVLIGGGGRLHAIYNGVQQPESQAEIALVVSFKRESAGLLWAKEQGLTAEYLRWADFKKTQPSRQAYDQTLVALLHKHRVELVVLAGWGLLLTEVFLQAYAGRVINVHPALLTDTFQTKVRLNNGHYIPVFRGNHALEMALHAGVNTTGCTVHYVTSQMDSGPVILKREVRIYPNDSLEILARRVHQAEDEILPLAIAHVCDTLLKQT